MDSPAVFSGTGGMCSPPYVNDTGFFHRFDCFRRYRHSNRIFRKSPLSDTDRTIAFRFRYSIYPYTQTNSSLPENTEVFSGRFVVFRRILPYPPWERRTGFRFLPAKLQLFNLLSHPQEPLINIRNLKRIGFQFFLNFFIFLRMNPAVFITELMLQHCPVIHGG